MFHKLIGVKGENTDHCFRCGQSFENLNTGALLTLENAPSSWVDCPGSDNVGTHHWVFDYVVDDLMGVECTRCNAFIGWHDSPYPPETCSVEE